jgi:DNA invertase Pin-like site-specific DNA recombinase
LILPPPHGKLTFHIFAAFVEFEWEIIRERTNAGLAYARGRGRKGGRLLRLSKESQAEAAAATSLYH